MPDNYDIQSYDIYDKGYKGGSQVNIFLGPIWIEEATFFQIDRTTTKKPIYGYNTIKPDRIIQGRYLVQGSLGINYVHANYLLQIIRKAREQSVNNTLQDIIVNRKSIFLQRMLENNEDFLNEHGMTIDNNGNIKVKEYVSRLCAEAELASSSGNSLDPDSFELTFVVGDLYDINQAVEIYEGVEIVGSGYRTANDDNVIIELYNWVSSGLKEYDVKQEEDIILYELNLSNLLSMARQMTERIVDKLLENAEVNIFKNNQRTRMMTDSAKLGLAGLLHPKTRMYGKSSNFLELVYALSLPNEYNVNLEDKEKYGEPIPLLVKTINVTDKQSNENNKDIYLDVPLEGEQGQSIVKGFDNIGGKLVRINKEITAQRIKAISPIKVQDLTERVGGSIAMPNYRRNDFNVGAFIPPIVVDSFDMEEKDIDTITYGTFWSNLTGYRSATSEGGNSSFITEIAQPLYSFAYVRDIIGDYSNDNFKIKIAEPIYIDFINLSKSSANSIGKVTKKELFPLEGVNYINFNFDKNNILTEIISETDDIRISESKIVFNYEKITVRTPKGVDYILGEGENPEPYFFESTILNSSSILASDFHKSLYVAPLIFEEKEGENPPYSSPGNNGEYAKNLSYFLSIRKGTDSSCEYHFDYDWSCVDITGMQTLNEKIIINGVYFINPKDVKSQGKKLHIFWIMALIPIKKLDEKEDQEEDQDLPNIAHDITTTGSNYVEFYNFTRCDNLYHIRSIYNIDPPSDFIGKIIAHLVDLYDSLRNVFNEDYQSNYAYPQRKNFNKVVAFIDGYSIDINRNNLIEQIKKCGFTGEINQYLKNVKGKINLETALQYASGGSDKNNEEILRSIINSVLSEKTSMLGVDIIDDPSTGILTLIYSTPVPPAKLIVYSMSDVGFNQLQQSRTDNINAMKGTKSETEEIPELIFGGYNQ